MEKICRIVSNFVETNCTKFLFCSTQFNPAGSAGHQTSCHISYPGRHAPKRQINAVRPHRRGGRCPVGRLGRDSYAGVCLFWLPPWSVGAIRPLPPARLALAGLVLGVGCPAALAGCVPAMISPYAVRSGALRWRPHAHDGSHSAQLRGDQTS